MKLEKIADLLKRAHHILAKKTEEGLRYYLRDQEKNEVCEITPSQISNLEEDLPLLQKTEMVSGDTVYSVGGRW